MKKYILFADEDLTELTHGREVKHVTITGEDLYFMSEEAYNNTYGPGISDDEWAKAINHLDELIVMYATIGWVGRFALDGVLAPLKKRCESGERTKELYDEIMSCK